MASLLCDRRNGKQSFRLSVGSGKNRRRVYLGDLNAAVAEKVRSNVNDLATAFETGTQPPKPTLVWLGSIDDDLHGKLANAGLIEPRAPKPTAPTIGKLIDDFIASRTNSAERTVINFKAARRMLCDKFGDDRQADTISRGDADDWQEWLISQQNKHKQPRYAPATISKTIKRVRQFFTYAVRKGWLAENAFDHLKPTGEVNRDRMFFVTRTMADAILEQCPTVEWRAIIGLCRFGMLRCPTEVLALQWKDIDFVNGRITVTCQKTKRFKGYRTIPLFAELREILEDCRDQVGVGVDCPLSAFVVMRYRSAKQNLRQQLQRFIRRAGLQPWERLFHNMRASRQSELVAMGFAAQTVCDWAGNSQAIAADHYLKPTDEEFNRAVGQSPWSFCGPDSGFGGHFSDQGAQEHENEPQRKPRVLLTELLADAFSRFDLIPPRGVEPLLPD